MTKEDTQQINEIKDMIVNHAKDQLVTDVAVARKIELLMPLADLIEPLRQIVEQQKVTQGMNDRFAKWARIVLTIGGVIAAIYGIISLIFRLEK